jgi:hypothetical protein
LRVHYLLLFISLGRLKDVSISKRDRRGFVLNLAKTGLLGEIKVLLLRRVLWFERLSESTD